MNKTLRKTMISTIAMLVVAVMSLTGVTYAWFSAADTATVNNFTMVVDDNAGGIEIATTFGEWKSTVDAPAIAQGTKFKAVSTVKALTDGNLSFYTGTLDPDNKAQMTTAAAATTDYVKFTLFFRNNGSQPVAFNLNGTTVTAASANAGDDIVKAARIAFVDWGSQTIADSGNSASNFTTPTAASAIQIYEPDATAHTTNGILDGAIQGSAHSYLGVAGVSDTMIDRKTLKDTVLVSVDTDKNLSDVEFTLAAGTYHKVDVYVWIEGQDADCQNDVAGENLNVKFMFTKVGAAVGE